MLMLRLNVELEGNVWRVDLLGTSLKYPYHNDVNILERYYGCSAGAVANIKKMKRLRD